MGLLVYNDGPLICDGIVALCFFCAVGEEDETIAAEIGTREIVRLG